MYWYYIPLFWKKNQQKKQMTKKTKQENAYAVNTMITLTQSQMIGKLCNIF